MCYIHMQFMKQFLRQLAPYTLLMLVEYFSALCKGFFSSSVSKYCIRFHDRIHVSTSPPCRRNRSQHFFQLRPSRLGQLKLSVQSITVPQLESGYGSLRSIARFQFFFVNTQCLQTNKKHLFS